MQKSAFSELWILMFELKQFTKFIYFCIVCVCVFFVNTWNEMRGVRAKKINSSRDIFGFIWPEIISVDEFTSIKIQCESIYIFIFFFVSLGNVYHLIWAPLHNQSMLQVCSHLSLWFYKKDYAVHWFQIKWIHTTMRLILKKIQSPEMSRPTPHQNVNACV